MLLFALCHYVIVFCYYYFVSLLLGGKLERVKFNGSAWSAGTYRVSKKRESNGSSSTGQVQRAKFNGSSSTGQVQRAEFNGPSSTNGKSCNYPSIRIPPIITPPIIIPSYKRGVFWGIFRVLNS